MGQSVPARHFVTCIIVGKHNIMKLLLCIVALGISGSWCCLSLGEKRTQQQRDIQNLEMEHRAGKGMSFGCREKNSIETEAAHVRRNNGNIRQIVQLRPQVWTPIVSASKMVEDTNYSGEEPNIITLE